jgi:signal recognition particle receptor subunit beta
MEILRLIVTGAPEVGKSTFIHSISELEAVNPNHQTSNDIAVLEKGKTATFDFGRLKVSPDIVMHLYGPPGQAGFDFMWDLLTHRAHACIMLLAAHRPREFSYSRRLLTFLRQRVNVPVIIGLTHMDHPHAWSVENITLALGYIDKKCHPPIIPVNPKDRASVIQVLTVLVEHLTLSTQCPKLQSSSELGGRTSHNFINNWKAIPADCNPEQVVGGECVFVSRK